MGLMQMGTSPNNTRAGAARVFDRPNIGKEPDMRIPKAEITRKANGRRSHKCQVGKARVVGDGPAFRRLRYSDPSALAKVSFFVFELRVLTFLPAAKSAARTPPVPLIKVLSCSLCYFSTCRLCSLAPSAAQHSNTATWYVYLSSSPVLS
jgi:hypothetical protein